MKIKFPQLVVFFAAAMAFFLPLHIGASNLFLILLFVGMAYHLVVQREFVIRNPRVLVFTFLPLFCLYVIGTFYSTPPFVGTKIMGRTISFLLCPLLLLFCPYSLLLRIKRSMFYGLVLGATVSVVFLLVNNVLDFYATRPFPSSGDTILSYYYTYHYFTKPVEIYPTYLGGYILFSIVIILHSLFKTRDFSILKWCMLFILSVGVLFINSRIVFLILGLIFIVSLALLVFDFLKRRKFLLPIVVTLTAIGLLVFGVQALSKTFIFSRFTDELEWELTNQANTTYRSKDSAGDSRIARWEAAVEAIEKKPIFGYGTYTEKTILGEFYLKNNLIVSYNNRYDAHNMYISFVVEYGILGLLLFLFYLFSNLWLALKFRDLELFFLICMIGIISCFENYISNNAAITFVALFATVLLLSHIPSTKAVL